MKEETMPTTVWITKYALTTGIIEGELEKFVAGYGSKLGVLVKPEGLNNGPFVFHGSDWHSTKEEAIADAEKRREKKIKSLENQIAKLKEMTFE